MMRASDSGASSKVALRVPAVNPALSPREMDVLSTYAELGEIRATADAVGLSSQTVKNHLRSIYAKLGVHSGMAAVYAMGWVK